ncbi:MAG: ABC-F family ATP-binding cassette domain-containing protein [Bacteroidales bacterium]|nr:ABC-F family ATP-binding cassette domain-containing protein [Bacteroidales bacterium]
MISINNLSVQFTGQSLFEGVTFNINDHDRIGLVGKNGAGKSTLLKILCRQQEPESGTLVIAGDQTVGYLPQEMIPTESGTVIDEALKAFDHINSLEATQQRLTQEIAERTDYESDDYLRLLTRHGEVTEQLALQSSHARRERAEKVLLGLGFLRTDLDRPVAEFSGGWQMRVELAKLLLRAPDFLLLDEPTNHLDIVSIQWLENFLATYPGAVVLVSHDRTFLDHVTRRTIEITAGRIYDYRVPYSEYVLQMQERRASQMAQLTNQQRQVAQIEAFIERFRYKATKSKQVQSRIKMLERMDRIAVDEVSTESIQFRFLPAPHSGKIVVETQQLGKAYGAHTVFSGVDLLVTKGSKIAFVGRNGEGKSTLAKIIVGDITDYSGLFRLGQQVQLGYYAQNQAALLDGEKTIFQTIDDIAVGEARPRIRSILGSFLFDDDDIEKRVKVLSGGEKARLALAKLLLQPSNLLVLDEPTNHLDMNSKDVLKNALLQYTGTLIVVSHDRDFLQGLTDRLYEFRDGGVHEFRGDIFEFLDARQTDSLDELRTAPMPAAESAAQPSAGRLSYEQSKERERELRKMRHGVEQTEERVAALEGHLAELEARLATGASDADLLADYNQTQQELQRQMDLWEELSVQLDTFLNP